MYCLFPKSIISYLACTSLTKGHCVVSDIIHTPPPPPRKVFVLHPIPPQNSSLASYFASKILTFKTPLPLGISDDLPWGGYGFFSGTTHLEMLRGGVGDLESQGFMETMK